MDKGSGTRSGLLWEVERIILECEELNKLPNVLVMENVPDVHGTKNMHNFAMWLERLEKLGYKNYWQDLNSRFYKIPQNRNRCFMVSILGDYLYEMPQEIGLDLRLKDLLDKNVEKKYYISNAQIQSFQNSSYLQSQRRLQEKDCCDTLCARDWKDPKLVEVGNLTNPPYDKMHESSTRVYADNGISPTVNTCGGGNLEPKIIEDFYGTVRAPRVYGDCPTLRADRIGLQVAEPIPLDEQNKCLREDGVCGTLTTDGSSPKHNNRVVEPIKYVDCPNYDKDIAYDYYTDATEKFERSPLPNLARTCKATMHDSGVVVNYRIRKLTPQECLKLMAVLSKDIETMQNCGLSNSALYKLAGNSIVTTCLMAIFGQLFDIDWKTKIEELVNKLKTEK